jgi:WXG100 family type VII secretion target
LGVGDFITKHLPGFPQGNPGELHAAASTWSNVASSLRSLVDDSQGRIASLSASWQGRGKDSFEQEWIKLAAAVRDGCDELAGVAAALNQAADKLSEAQHRYEVTVGAAAGTVAVGVALTVFTFGASDGVAAGATAAEVGAAVEVATEAVTTAETLLASAVSIASQIATRFVVFLGVDLASQAAISTVVYSDHNPFGHLDFNSAISLAAGMAMPDIPGGAVAQIGAGAAFGAGQDALTQLLTTGKVDPGEVLFNGALGGLGAGVGVGLSKGIGRLGEDGILSRAPEDVVPVEDPVDIATGDVILSQVDLALPGVLALVLERVHRSAWQVGRWFGPSWVSSFDQRLEVSDTGVRALFSDGRILTWPVPSGDAAPLLPVSGAAWPLSPLSEGGYTVTDPKRGLTWRFSKEPERSGDDAAAQGSLVEIPLVEIRHRGGQRISFRYDEDGYPQGISHSGGYDAVVTVDAGHVANLALRAPDGDITVTRYEYDEGGRLAAVINSSGLPLRFSYDHAGRLTGWLDRNGYSYHYSYDALGRCVRGEGPGGALSGTFSYDEHALTSRWTDASGAVTMYELTPSRRVAAITDPLGHVTSWEHDDRGRVTTRSDQLGRVTRYAYDGADNVIAVTRPDGAQAVAVYDKHSRPVTLTEPDGATWRQEYDARGNRTALIAPDGAITRFSYDTSGHLASVTDAEGAVTQVSCDAAGLPVAVIRPGGGQTRCTRDPFGRITHLARPDGGTTTLSWTIEGLLSARTLPDGASEIWAYDGEGNLTSHLDAVGGRTRYEYGPFDLLTALTRPDGARSDFAYDHELRPVSISHAGLDWYYEYDAAGRLISETDYNDATTTYAYDPAGQLSTRVNTAGQRSTFVYDRIGNLTERVTDDDVARFGYDLSGRLVGARNGDAYVRFDRDAVGRVTAETCNGRAVISSHDLVGRLTSRTLPSGSATHWAYDPDGQPTMMSADGHEIRFRHDASGRETHRDLPGGLMLTQDWDQRGRLTSQSLVRTGVPLPEGPSVPVAGRIVQRREYSYRPDGFVAGIDDLLAGYRAIGLNPTGRVTAVTGRDWAEQYAYDGAGNVTSASWPVPVPAAHGADAIWQDAGAQGQRDFSGTLIRRAGNIRYQHDRQGRVIQRQRTRISRKPDTWRYEWDAGNRLTSVTTPDGTVWRYRYDPFGRRVAKQRLAADGNVAEQTDFTWDGLTLVEQSASSVASARESVVSWNYRPGSFTPLTQAEFTLPRGASQERVDERFYAIVTDLIGTPAELTDLDGTVAGHQRQTLWGGTTWDPGGATTPLRFPGQYEDSETGLYYNNQRYYDPVSSNYLSPDPLGLDAAPNPHAYVANPYAEADPLGLMACSPRVSPMASDWATKGAHIHIGGNEVRIFPDHEGGIGVEPIRLSTGIATKADVQTVLDAVHSSPELRQDLIIKTEAAMREMNSGNWGNALNRAPEMHFLIKALRRMS